MFLPFIMNHVKTYLMDNNIGDSEIKRTICKLRQWNKEYPEARILLGFQGHPSKDVARKLIDQGILGLLCTCASFVAPLVDRKTLVRDYGFGGIELFLIAHYTLESEITNEKFSSFCAELKRTNQLFLDSKAISAKKENVDG